MPNASRALRLWRQSSLPERETREHPCGDGRGTSKSHSSDVWDQRRSNPSSAIHFIGDENSRSSVTLTAVREPQSPPHPRSRNSNSLLPFACQRVAVSARPTPTLVRRSTATCASMPEPIQIVAPRQSKNCAGPHRNTASVCAGSQSSRSMSRNSKSTAHLDRFAQSISAS
jgi:hypothetical protein